MSLGIIEILALVLIAIALIKLVIFIIKPEIWFDFIELLYRKPEFTSSIALLLAIVVLFFLLDSGMTIAQILATCLFVALLIMMGFASYSNEILSWARGQEPVYLIKKLWIYWLVWILLLGWGIASLVPS